MKKNRIAYLVIDDVNSESFLYTDIRKVKGLIKTNNNLIIYLFTNISKDDWNEKEVYKLENNNYIKIRMFEDNNCTYSDLGCFIMKSLATAKWNSSIQYPDNGWHICSVCGEITNDIDKCFYCEDFVCWDCSHSAVNNDWEEGCYCSYECYRNYLEEECGIPYNPEDEYEESVCNHLERILSYFDKEQLLDILINVESINYDLENENNIINDELKLQYENMTEDELLEILDNESSSDICSVLIKLYENETDERLQDILDGEAFINNLDPNDPADAWFFED